MSTVKTVNLQHPSAAAPNLVLSSTGNVAGAGLDLVAASTFTTAASVSINNCFTSTYDQYAVLAQVSALSTAMNLSLRMRAASSDNSSSNYYFNGSALASSSVSTFTAFRSVGAAALFQLTDSSATDDAFISAHISGPALSFYTAIQWEAVSVNATDVCRFEASGRMSVTTAYDGLSLIASTGTITGSLYVYGYRKAA